MDRLGPFSGQRYSEMVKDVMRTGHAIPSIDDGELLSSALTEMTKKGLGLTAIINAAKRGTTLIAEGRRAARPAGAGLGAAPL